MRIEYQALVVATKQRENTKVWTPANEDLMNAIFTKGCRHHDTLKIKNKFRV